MYLNTYDNIYIAVDPTNTCKHVHIIHISFLGGNVNVSLDPHDDL